MPALKSKKARLGFIGTGVFINSTHLLTASQSPFMEIRAIADLNEMQLAKHQAEKKVGYTTTNYHELLNDNRIDIIVIGTKQDLHATMIIEALDAGKWVFCEKPMCETTEEEAEVLAAEQRNPGRLAIGFNRRFAPAYVKALQIFNHLPRPWLINYRCQCTGHAKHTVNSFYYNRPHIIFEGCHILDLASYMFGETPKRVFMSGDPLHNNCVIMEYADGSQFSLMLTSVGSVCMWKEYMEMFAEGAAITISEFTDMRIRGIPGEFDMLFNPRFDEHAEELQRWGFDFYEMFTNNDLIHGDMQFVPENYMLPWEQVRRPERALQFDISQYPIRDHQEIFAVQPDKGWKASFEHFVNAFLEGKIPYNADGKAGKLANDLGFALIKSAERKESLLFNG